MQLHNSFSMVCLILRCNLPGMYILRIKLCLACCRFLMDSDPAIQKLSLECLLNWRDGYLTLYVEHLENLISHSTLREELVTWNVSTDSHQVQAEHREGLLAVVLSILYPKIMKRSTKASGKVRVNASYPVLSSSSFFQPSGQSVVYEDLGVVPPFYVWQTSA